MVGVGLSVESYAEFDNSADLSSWGLIPHDHKCHKCHRRGHVAQVPHTPWLLLSCSPSSFLPGKATWHRLSLGQSFSAFTLLVFGDRSFSVAVAVLCIAGCLTASLASTHNLGDVSSIPQTAAIKNVSGHWQMPLGEQHCPWLKTTVLDESNENDCHWNWESVLTRQWALWAKDSENMLVIFVSFLPDT